MEKGLLHKQIMDFFVRNFDVRQEKEDELETIESIKKGIEFKGTNLWVLIFATFVASLGLNTNSTAVIIGAMLISPLMGPIMGFYRLQLIFLFLPDIKITDEKIHNLFM